MNDSAREIAGAIVATLVMLLVVQLVTGGKTAVQEKMETLKKAMTMKPVKIEKEAKAEKILSPKELDDIAIAQKLGFEGGLMAIRNSKKRLFMLLFKDENGKIIAGFPSGKTERTDKSPFDRANIETGEEANITSIKETDIVREYIGDPSPATGTPEHQFLTKCYEDEVIEKQYKKMEKFIGFIWTCLKQEGKKWVAVTDEGPVYDIRGYHKFFLNKRAVRSSPQVCDELMCSVIE